jgi:HEAT repeat protein
MKTLFKRKIIKYIPNLLLSALLVLVIVSTAAAAYYVYYADEIDPDILNYYQNENSRPHHLHGFSRIIRNSKALFGKKVSEFVHWRTEANYLRTHLNEKEIIDRFLNQKTSTALKIQDAWRLGVMNTDASYNALLTGMKSDNPDIRRAVAVALGHSTFPDAGELLRQMLNDENEDVAAAAVKALALFDDDDSIDLIASILENENNSENLRIAAAAALGTSENTSALRALTDAFYNSGTYSENLYNAVIQGISNFPFVQSQPVFEDIINNQNYNQEQKIYAIETLVNSDEDALPFLYNQIETSENPEIRAAAAWTLGANPDSGDYSEKLTNSLMQEPDSKVRRRIYEALLTQKNPDAEIIINHAEKEEDPAAFIAGADAAAAAIRKSKNNIPDEIITQFDSLFVPSLRKTIFSDNASLNLKMRSLIALKLAGTPESVKLLKEIKNSDNSPLSRSARSALNSLNE